MSLRHPRAACGDDRGGATQPPVLATHGGARHSAEFGGSRQAAHAFEADLRPPPPRAHHLMFSGERALGRVRQMADSHAADADLDPQRAADLRLAVSELVANSVAHGGGSGSLTIWRQDGFLVCEVRDAGRISDVLAGRVEPRAGRLTGRGLWLVNQICGLVQLRSSGHG